MTEHLQPYGEIQFRHIKGTQLTFFNGILNEIRGEQGNAAIQLCQFHGGDGVPEIKPRLDEVGEGVFGVLIGHIGEIELLICDNHIIFRDFRQSDYGLFRQRASGGSHKDIMRFFQDGFDEIFCPSLIMDNEGKIDLILGKHALREKNIIGCFYDDIYLGVRAVIFPQDIGEDSGKGGIETGKAQCSLQLLLLAADGSRLLSQSDNLLCIGFQLMPFYREVDILADAV